jgi:hypothetical protein
MNILQNHPQTHHDKHTTYFYKNTIQLKDVYQQPALETKKIMKQKITTSLKTSYLYSYSPNTNHMQ